MKNWVGQRRYSNKGGLNFKLLKKNGGRFKDKLDSTPELITYSHTPLMKKGVRHKKETLISVFKNSSRGPFSVGKKVKIFPFSVHLFSLSFHDEPIWKD